MRKAILISTDEMVVHLLKSNTELLNIDVEVIAYSGDILREIKMRTPDLLIIDFILNNDNGGALCHQIKLDAKLHDLPVVLISDYTSLNAIAAKFGCSTFITKPLKLTQLLDTITKLLQPQSVPY